MKKKYIIVIGVAALLAVAAIGGTLASDYVETKSKLEAKISEKTLSVAIVDEKNEKIDEDKPLGTDVVPGGEILLNRSISNPHRRLRWQLALVESKGRSKPRVNRMGK